jgi:hypothetical protein
VWTVQSCAMTDAKQSPERGDGGPFTRLPLRRGPLPDRSRRKRRDNLLGARCRLARNRPPTCRPSAVGVPLPTCPAIAVGAAAKLADAEGSVGGGRGARVHLVPRCRDNARPHQGDGHLGGDALSLRI